MDTQNQNNYYYQQGNNINYSNNNNLNPYNNSAPNNEPFNENKNVYDIESKNVHQDIIINIRLGFIKKVYAILSAQLLLTCLFISMTFYDSFANFLKQNIAIFYICIGVSLILGFILICFKSTARTVPTNYILLAAWTFCESWMVATASSLYEPRTVMIAGALTAAVTVALTFYACTTKTDFTYCGGMLFAGAAILLFMGIFFLIFGQPSGQYHPINIIYCGLGVFVYSIYLIYDTQLVKGQFGQEYQIDDYILAAMMIYIDIIQLFLYILRMLGSRR